MNRTVSLRRALSTWLAIAEVDRYIVVDWGSREPLAAVLSDFNDPRLIVARAVNQKHWRNAACHNLEIQLAGDSGLLLRLDNDVLVRRDFLELRPQHPLGFYAGNWRTVPSNNDDKRNLAGTLLIELEYVRMVGGYNERLVHYGREDDDLYARLTMVGYRWHEFRLETLEHMFHSNLERFENLAVARELDELTHPTLVAMSSDILRKQPWTSHDRPTQWTVERISERYWECRENAGGGQ
jgi:hypothetical protein